MQYKYEKTLLIPSSEMTDNEIGKDIIENTGAISKSTLHQWIEDISFFTKIKSNISSTCVKQLSWAPRCNKVSDKSYLTLLLDCGSLDIYKLKQQSWHKICSISGMWLDYCLQKWNNSKIMDENATTVFRNRAQKAKITAFVWGNISYEEKNIYCCLFTSNMWGDITVWNIHPNSTNCDMQLDLLCVTETTLGQITSLWFQKIDQTSGMLLASSLDGRIQVVPIVISKEGGSIIFESWLPIWNDKDRIIVAPNGTISFIYNDSIIFVVAKEGHLLIFQFKQVDNTLKNSFVHDSGDIAVTGFAMFSENSVILTTRCGNILTLSIEDDISFKPKLTKIRTSLRSDHYSSYGIALSRSKAIAVISYSVCKNYDHLAMREPTHLAWCTLPGLFNSSVIINNHHNKISDICDALDLYRIECIQRNENGFILPTLKDLDVMDITELKKNLWLVQISCLLNMDSETLDSIVKMKDQIVLLVLSCNIFRRITNFLPSNQLTEFNKLSLFLMRRWLEYLLQTLDPQFEITKATASTILKQFDDMDFGIDQELCAICSSEIPAITSPGSSLCAKGHTVPRCSLSLIQCDIVPYYYCVNCQAMAHPQAVTEDECSCIYCDVLLEEDPNILKE